MITKITFSYRKLLSLALAGLIGLGVWIFHSSLAPVLAMLADRQATITYVQRFGSLGPLVLFLLLMAQVFIAVVPGHALMMAGGYIYGPMTAIPITAASTILGSQAAFWMARKYGRQMVYRLANKKNIEQWDHTASRQGGWFFFFAFVLPIFPSDLMCYVAGLGKVAPLHFLAANIAGRLLCAISITLIGCFGFHPPWQYLAVFGSGMLIFFTAWSMYKWKGLLPRWKEIIAHALGMGIMRIYRRGCSIQICVKGMENIPPGPKILAANHPNLSDTYLLPLLFDGKVRTLAQASQFRAPILGWILTHTGQIPVFADRRQAAFPLALQALANGDTLLVYPEGRLNPDNIKLNSCTGAVRMALSSGAPIIPIGIHVAQRDTLRVSPASYPVASRKLWQVRGTFNLQIGEAWHVSKDPAFSHTTIEAHALTKVLMEKIECLRNQAVKESEK